MSLNTNIIMNSVECPACGHSESFVIDSRRTNTSQRRRRECMQCSIRWTTYEVSEADYLTSPERIRAEAFLSFRARLDDFIGMMDLVDWDLSNNHNISVPQTAQPQPVVDSCEKAVDEQEANRV